MSFRALREGGWVFASKARSGLIPLLPGLVCGWGRKYGGVKKRFQI